MAEDIVVGVGLSTKWSAKEAGREVAVNLQQKLGRGVNPDIILLFSSIHYRTRGGFQELLSSIYEVFPKETSLVGGTVAGFVVPQGCFTHGVVAFGIKSDAMDISTVVAYNIKRDPRGSALCSADKIRLGLSKSKFKNRFLFNFPSGITTPKIPGFPENQRVIRSIFLSKLLRIGIKLSGLLLQKGPGREELIIEALSEKLSDFKIIGGSSVDDNRGYYNYQFFNQEVGTNMLISLGIATKFDLSIKSDFGLIRRGETFNITKKSTHDMIIEEINGKAAFGEMLRILRWPKAFLEDNARILRRTFYAPIGYVVDGKLYTSTMAFIFGNGILVSPKVMSNEACIMTASGKQLIDVVDNNLSTTDGTNIKFGLIVSCIARLETLGAKTYEVRKKLLKHFNGQPFLEIYTVGEDVYTPGIGAKRMTTSYNSAVFYLKESDGEV